MNGRIPRRLLAATVLVIAACATPYEPPPVVVQVPIPPPDISMDLPLEPPDESKPHFCHLGTTCLSMDPRPFELCLLSTVHCRDKGGPLLATDKHDAETDE